MPFDKTHTPAASINMIISLPFAAMICVVIIIEYALFKKKGPEIAKYCTVVDLILYFFFLGDWITGVLASLYRYNKNTHPPTFSISALFGFTSFSWRTLLVTLLVQKWQLKIIAPVVVSVMVTVYTVYFLPGNALFLMLRAVFQIFNIIIIVYCEDKVKWELMRTNLEQEKWMQVNNFILDSIPENIMILDIGIEREVKFMSEHCKLFMKKFGLEMKEFFESVRELQEYESVDQVSPSITTIANCKNLQMERLTTCNGLIFDTKDEGIKWDQVDALEKLIENFKTIIEYKNLKERQFLVYNGKLKMMLEDIQQSDKSIEVKISFVKHMENEYIILIFRDTTQRDLLITLEETNKYKDQLLASVSHELRAPLNGNINLVESAINSPKIPEKIKEALLIPALRSSKFLLHIINDILDMSQIKEKKLRLVFQPGNLIETLKSTAQLVEIQAKKKGIDLVLDLNMDLPKDFCTDHIRLSQIALNLLTNAIKFTKEGGVIKLTAKSFNDDGSWVKICVEDSGIGMTKEDLDKLFSSYTYIYFKGRQTMNPTGVGLGLNIAFNLVKLLAPDGHKNIDVVSSVNQGSTFTFIIENKEDSLIPYEDFNTSKDLVENSSFNEIADELVETRKPMVNSKFNQTFALSLHSPEPQSDLFSDLCFCPKVLIVDDNPFNTMALETILGSLDIKCDSVYSGSACLQKLIDRQTKSCCRECKSFAVVFMDQEMPEMSGSETVKEIKRLQNDGLLPEMRIIGCTAHKAKEEVDKFLEAGLDQCIYKPISIGMIKDSLKEVLLN